MTKKLCIIVLLAVLAGCATAVITKGVDFNDTRADEIVKGKTTKAEISRMFGAPFQKSVTDSTETWVYSYTKSSAEGSSVLNITTVKGDILEKNLTVEFDRSDVVKTFSYISSAKGKGQMGLTVEDDGYVRSVDRDGPAHRAGVLKGDIVLKVNGTEFPKGNTDFQRFMLAGSPGERVELWVERDGKEQYFIFFRE